MGSAIAAVVAGLTASMTWLVGFALLALVMSGDGSRGHLPVFGVYFFGGITTVVWFARLAWKATPDGESRSALGVVALSLGGAGVVVLLAVLSLALGALMNAR